MNDIFLSPRALWDRHAAHDPLFPILSDPARSARRWVIGDLMSSGEREIALLVLELRRRAVTLEFGLSVDFGCGVGRLTQAMARRFKRVIGFDISPEMLRLATGLNRYAGVEYLPSEGPAGIRTMQSNMCDLVYSNIVLQHIEPAMSRAYISEFVRIAKPGASVVFQLPAEEVLELDIQVRPMPDDAYRTQLLLLKRPSTVSVSQSFPLSLLISNTSGLDWRQPEVGSLRVGNHWLDETGDRMVAQDDGRATLPQVISAGEEFQIMLECKAPAQTGHFVVEVDLVHEGITWFARKGSSTLRLPLEVTDGVIQEETLDLMEEFEVPVYEPGEFERLLPPRSDIGAQAPGFPMFGVPKADVIGLVRAAGASVVHIEDDGRAGTGWTSYRYFVTKD